MRLQRQRNAIRRPSSRRTPASPSPSGMSGGPTWPTTPGTALLAERPADEKLSGPAQDEPGTVQDFAFEFAVPCAATADPNIGSTCAIDTTADAVTPGAVTEVKRTIWQLGQLGVFDGGGDGVAARLRTPRLRCRACSFPERQPVCSAARVSAGRPCRAGPGRPRALRGWRRGSARATRSAAAARACGRARRPAARPGSRSSSSGRGAARWCSIAKRCASSRMRWSSWSAVESRGSRSARPGPGT